MDIEMQPKGPRKVTKERLFERFAAGLNLVFGKTSNPQAAFDDALHGLEFVFRAGVDETEQALDNPCCGAIALEVDKQTAVVAVDLRRFLGIISKVVNIQAWKETMLAYDI